MQPLFEELFLLAIHEEKGTVLKAAAKQLKLAYSGALLMELALLNKLGIDDSHRVVITDPTETGDRLYDRAFSQIKTSKHPRKTTYWVKSLVEPQRKKERQLGRRLAGKGLVREDDLRWILTNPDPEHPDRPASVKYWLKNRLRDIVLICTAPDLHDLALLSLAKASDLLFLIFTRDEIKTAERRIYELQIENALTSPQFNSVEEISAAVGALAAAD